MLNNKLNYHYDPEEKVVANRLANVDFLGADQTTIYLVEQGHQDERVEHDCVQTQSISRLAFKWSFFVPQLFCDEIERLLEEHEGPSIH